MPAQVIVPEICSESLPEGIPCTRKKQVFVIVKQSIASLKVTVMGALTATQVASLAGLVVVTVGGPAEVKLKV